MAAKVTAPEPPPGAEPAYKVGDDVEAQCAGWGDDWFPASVRELLPNGEVQVLWEDDNPTISNVAPGLVRHRRKPGDSVSSTAPESTPQATSVESATSASAGVTAADSSEGKKRTFEEMTESAKKASSETTESLLRFDLSPGEDFATAFASLRRRLETELKNGRKMAVSLVISRPPDRPEAEVPPAPEPPAAPAPPAPAAPGAETPQVGAATTAPGGMVPGAPRPPLQNGNPAVSQGFVPGIPGKGGFPPQGVPRPPQPPPNQKGKGWRPVGYQGGWQGKNGSPMQYKGMTGGWKG